MVPAGMLAGVIRLSTLLSSWGGREPSNSLRRAVVVKGASSRCSSSTTGTPFLSSSLKHHSLVVHDFTLEAFAVEATEK